MAIIFDLDGTLINSFNVHSELIKKAIDRVIGKRSISLTFIQNNIRFPSKKMLGIASEKYGLNLTTKQMKDIIKLKDELFTEKYIKRIRFYPGALQLINFLKNKKINFCIATSMNDEELAKVEPYLNLYSITKVVNSPALKYEKPDPYVINKAIELIKAKRKKTVYVGDAETDYEASVNAGVKFIGVNNPLLKNLGYKYFKDIKSLSSFIKKNYLDFL
ncbi:MAG: HAD family hydrolase [Candidatus Parvarchaeota archaeon]|nr:HAD family hydrolase [Candidatus Parvarchaeum tengchongense]MCW1295894.1 HAD family hydrolase [Candidatus Parvarchaeum tengchongense]MCW1299135.1 HAD family hydrolase [Candidatus Parvarchaeum tengchongense]MCW1312098.1 HAD family hydrolase [Candidatus Parvarchaeum tengchongense]